jgi:hypothetical protein
MMLPEGHVTDTPGLTRNQALKALGNGVVPAQCAAALRAYLSDEYGVPVVTMRRDPEVPLLPTPNTMDGLPTRSDEALARAKESGGCSNLKDHPLIRGEVTLLPTPAVNDMGEGKTVEAWDEWTAKMQTAHGNGNGHGKSLAIEAQRIGGKR